MTINPSAYVLIGYKISEYNDGPVSTLEDARGIVSKLFPERKDIEIIGFGLHELLVEEFIECEAIDEPEDDNGEFIKGSNENNHPLVKPLIQSQKRMVKENGKVLGHELCSLNAAGDLEVSFEAMAIMKANKAIITEAGLIESIEEAEEFSEQSEALGIEENLWPILVVKY